MKRTILAAAVAITLCAQAGTPAEEQLLKDLPGIFEKSGAHYRALLEAMKAHGPDMFPKRFQDGKLVVISTSTRRTPSGRTRPQPTPSA